MQRGQKCPGSSRAPLLLHETVQGGSPVVGLLGTLNLLRLAFSGFRLVFQRIPVFSMFQLSRFPREFARSGQILQSPRAGFQCD